MELISATTIWQRTLGSTDYAGGTAHFVERLRQSFILFRAHALEFAKHLTQDLRQLTVHDESHTDALWEVFDVVFPAEMVANPLEAYVLGGAFLVHDLGHALCMYPGGLEELQATDAWRRARYSVGPDGDETAVVELAIRLNHAVFARTIAEQAFGDNLYLIDDAEIRKFIGRLIGLVAHSHWWTAQQLNESGELGMQGAMPVAACPSSWTIDARKLGYFLRVCDACQIDARRAPILVQALRKPTGISANHWNAQRSLAKPYGRNGELFFTSATPFHTDYRNAWWTAYDLAQIADKELREAATFFSNSAVKPNVNRVAGASSPRAFASYVQVDGWDPIETRPTITAVAKVITRLGGSALYGANLLVPLRELIQNARDAVCARRVEENRASNWGAITIELEQTESVDVLTITDDGIGLSEAAILKYLLDFGASYWRSVDCLDEHPSLDFEQFNPVGFYGIGFYSVFMLGTQVTVTTRCPADSQSQTRVLEFLNGIEERPVLRLASRPEQMIEPGTRVKVSIVDKSVMQRMLTPQHEMILPLMHNARFRPSWSIAEAIEWICPASDVDLLVRREGQEIRIVAANDWEELPPEQLFRRLFLHREDVDSVLSSPRSQFHLRSLEPIRTQSGALMGRASLSDNLAWMQDSSGLYGIVTNGPFRSSMELYMPGLLLGAPSSAARNNSRPLAMRGREMSEWASQMAQHANASAYFNSNLRYKVGLAAYVRSLCGDMMDMSVYLYLNQLVTLRQLISTGLVFPEVLLFHHDTFSGLVGAYDGENPSHIGVFMGRMTNGKLLQSTDPLNRAVHPRWDQYWYSLWGAAIEAISIAWKCDLTKLLEAATAVNVDGLSLEPAIFRKPA